MHAKQGVKGRERPRGYHVGRVEHALKESVSLLLLLPFPHHLLPLDTVL
jgi:hypothetical protein